MSEVEADGGRFDVAVAGGGPAGAAIAARLAAQGRRVLLVEARGFEAPRAGETLAPAAQPLLRELGVWDRFLALDPIPSWGTRSVWGGPDPEAHAHMMDPYGCGWHVDRRRLDGMLADAAADAGAELRIGAELTDCRPQRDGGWRVTVRRGTRMSDVTARFVVDATGRGARLGERLGGERVVYDRLVGIGVTLDGASIEQERYTLVETCPEGWWYSAPVGERRLMVMLMTDGDICSLQGLGSLDRWAARLREADATSARTAGWTVASPPRVFWAATQRLHRAETRSSWLAVGDASLAVDPVTGSGVVRALRAAAAGCTVVLRTLGDPAAGAIAGFERAQDVDCATYFEERARYYAMERRWLASPFWARRCTRTEHTPTLTAVHR